MKLTHLPIFLLSASALASPSAAWAQHESDRDFREADERSLYESVSALEKKTDKFNLFLNMHADFEALWRGSTFDHGKFQMRQLRVEARGNINDWLSYRYRQRLNNGDNSGYYDNILRSIDYAAVGIKLDKWQFLIGKQCSAFGGIEFDLNPIEIYEYSDIVGSFNSFLTGVDVAYNFTPKQQVHVQVVNSNALPIKEEYGDYEASKMPLMYSVNWNGNFNNVYETRWSASLMNEVKDKYMYYFALGNELSLGKFGAYFDWMYSIEGVDRRGILTSIVGGDNPVRKTEDVNYMACVLHLNYRFAPKWNVFAKATYETQGIFKTHCAEYDGDCIELEKGRYRTSYGYVGGIEYYPLEKGNLHFFLVYAGRSFRYTSRAEAFGSSDYSTNRISAGLIWHMPVF